jgi:aspartate aminotransferase/aminotransferase
MILNTPSNPTGAVVPLDRLRAIGDLLVDRDHWAIVDETYEDLVYADATHHSLASDPALFDRTVTVHTFSKSYAMTGWRLGYATAPAEVISPMRVLQEHTVSCVAEPTQVAGLAALDHRGIVDEIHDELAGRRRLILDRLEGIDGVDPGDPRGAFYVFADVSDVTTDSLGFVDHLLETAQVGAIPGSVFGDAGEGFVRLSYATDRGTIETAMDGMATAVAEWD